MRVIVRLDLARRSCVPVQIGGRVIMIVLGGGAGIVQVSMVVLVAVHVTVLVAVHDVAVTMLVGMHVPVLVSVLGFAWFLRCHQFTPPQIVTSTLAQKVAQSNFTLQRRPCNAAVLARVRPHPGGTSLQSCPRL